MSTATEVTAQGITDPSTAVHPTDPAERGTLVIQDRVVERVAGHAVTLVGSAAASPRRLLGVNLGEARPDDQAHVDARVDGDVAVVEASIAVQWPASVRSVAEQTRRRIREEVSRVTGVRVDHVDIEVVSMDVPTRTRPRVR